MRVDSFGVMVLEGTAAAVVERLRELSWCRGASATSGPDIDLGVRGRLNTPFANHPREAPRSGSLGLAVCPYGVMRRPNRRSKRSPTPRDRFRTAREQSVTPLERSRTRVFSPRGVRDPNSAPTELHMRLPELHMRLRDLISKVRDLSNRVRDPLKKVPDSTTTFQNPALTRIHSEFEGASMFCSNSASCARSVRAVIPPFGSRGVSVAGFLFVPTRGPTRGPTRRHSRRSG